MEREKGMSEYREEVAGILQEHRAHMAKHVLEYSEKLEYNIKSAVDELCTKMEQQQKEYVSFLYISMPKINLLQRNFQFVLQAFNYRWYLDDESIEVYFHVEGLFEPLEHLWDVLTEKSSMYRRFVNQYDVQHIIFEELSFIDAAISRILRYRLRNWEEKDMFSNIIRTPLWFLKWGEFQDQTEFIIHIDRTEKDESVWKKELKKAKRNQETMVFSYWYQGEYEDSTLKELDMRFIGFEECKLNKININQCNLEGAKFNRCNITNCSFEGCNLSGADFTGCSFEEVSFLDAELAEALFPASSVPFLNLTPEQLQMIQLVKEEIG